MSEELFVHAFVEMMKARVAKAVAGGTPAPPLTRPAKCGCGPLPCALVYRAAVGLAAARVGLGIAAIVAPQGAGRAWIGDGARGRDRAVLQRALGGRDLALGAGALLAARGGRSLRAWVAMGALSDLVDTCATGIALSDLPRRRRWLVLAASAGAAALGVLVTARLPQSS